MTTPSRRPSILRTIRPAQVIALAFAGVLAVGTALLSLPIAVQGRSATFMEALFTATSALCVTGHIIVDTPTFWSPFGQGVILALIQIGGFGVMSLATLLGLLVARRLGLRTRLSAVSETHTVAVGDVRRVLKGVALITVTIQAAVALILAARWWIGYDKDLGDALYLGVFHAVSSFNNAGFALFSDNLVSFAADPWICLPICAAIILGGLGFPVIMELRKRIALPRSWTLNTVTVIVGSVVLLVVGTIVLTILEWSNPATLGALDPAGRLLAGFTSAVMPRTAGFNSIDVSQMHPASWLVTDILMFIGGGPAGTAGGLKITTFAVLFFIIVAELRGDTAVNMFGKRLPRSTHREALTVALLSVALVVASTLAIMLMTGLGLDRVLFEVISAFATVGLSTGITASLPPAAQAILIVLMFIGRLGPVALGSALALTIQKREYELPKERPIIG
ncbi:potassium uptake TrkH family protein [Labedella gwakjiensis]|uniref:Potassium uptake TrkH family protein n=1 Tax=Labedella gwakjiensis TaxID=390269 RepID=A0A2P8GV17_9MICO|nr:potassium transporter TrkG [Labedella gwakjiensis]PSL37812.1 potassium uptake TrkH family protein [Labedella gwakjiensis]RUQ87611.1 TrkH family potassium uptake protein [Labedella gwakjiensis]